MPPPPSRHRHDSATSTATASTAATTTFAASTTTTCTASKDIQAFKTQLALSEGKPEYTFYDGPPFATGTQCTPARA